MKQTMIALLILITSLDISLGQEWRGIKPLRSTCEDVKRALGVDNCEYPKSVYSLKEETVTVGFIMCPCPILCYHQSSGWDVPRGTVGGVTRELHKPIPVSNFDVNNGKWTTRETDFIGQVLYNNYDEGISLSAIKGEVVRIHYYAPRDKHKDKLCPPCTVAPSHNQNDDRSTWISGYGNVNLEVEKERLDAFARQLTSKEKDLLGYIVAYDSCQERGEARLQAERAKKYLVDSKGIEHRRIEIIDGGQHDEMAIELHVRRRGLSPPKTSSSIYPKTPE